jgi:hypothetical protein
MQTIEETLFANRKHYLQTEKQKKKMLEAINQIPLQKTSAASNRLMHTPLKILTATTKALKEWIPHSWSIQLLEVDITPSAMNINKRRAMVCN